MTKRLKFIILGIAMLSIILSALFIINDSLSPNLPFQLCGRVLDGDGRPIPDVKISAELWYEGSLIHVPLPWTGNPAVMALETTTNQNGDFFLKGRGHTLGIEIAKDGWCIAPSAPQAPYRFNVPEGIASFTRISPAQYRMMHRTPTQNVGR